MSAKITTATATPSTTATTPLGLTGTLVRPRALSLCALSVLASSLDLCLLSPTISWAATDGTVLRHACAIRPHQGRSRPYCSVADITILVVLRNDRVTAPVDSKVPWRTSQVRFDE